MSPALIVTPVAGPYLTTAQAAARPETVAAALYSQYAYIRNFATSVATAEIAMLAISFALMAIPLQRASEYGASRLLRHHASDGRTLLIYCLIGAIAFATALLGAYAPMGLPQAYCSPLVLAGLLLSVVLMYLHYAHVAFALDLDSYMRPLLQKGRRLIASYEERYRSQIDDSWCVGVVRAELDEGQGLRYLEPLEASRGVLHAESLLGEISEPLTALMEVTQRFVVLGRSEYASRGVGAVAELTVYTFRPSRLERVTGAGRIVFVNPMVADLQVVLQRLRRWHARARLTTDDQLAASVYSNTARMITAAAISERGTSDALWRYDSLTQACVQCAAAMVEDNVADAQDIMMATDMCGYFHQAIAVTWGTGHVRYGRTLLSAFARMGRSGTSAHRPTVASASLEVIGSAVRMNLAEPTSTFFACTRAVVSALRAVLLPLVTSPGADEVRSYSDARRYCGSRLFMGVGSPLVEVATWGIDELSRAGEYDEEATQPLEEMLGNIVRFYRRMSGEAGRSASPVLGLLAVDLNELLGAVRGVMESPLEAHARARVERVGMKAISGLREQLVRCESWPLGMADEAADALFREGMWFARGRCYELCERADAALREGWEYRATLNTGEPDCRQGGLLDRVIGIEIAWRCSAGPSPQSRSRMNWIARVMRDGNAWFGLHDGDESDVGSALDAFLGIDGDGAEVLQFAYSFPPGQWTVCKRELVAELGALMWP